MSDNVTRFPIIPRPKPKAQLIPIRPAADVPDAHRAQDLKIVREDFAHAAKKLMADYFQRFGGVRDYLRSVVEQARAQGYTETLFGRRRPFPDLASPNRVLRDNAERAALNAPMQGTAADIMKIAMIGIEQDLVALELKSQLLLQVHDELVLEVIESEREQVEKIVIDRMAHAAKLSVPLDVQIGIGSNWNEAAH